MDFKKVLAKHGIEEPTRGQKKAIRKAGVGLYSFIPANADNVTREEVEAIEKAHETVVDVLGVADIVDGLPECEAREVDQALFRLLFTPGMSGGPEKNLRKSGGGKTTKPAKGTAKSAGS